MLLEDQRRNLPIWPVRKRLLKEIAKADTTIIIGETGCGKTTQLPQFLYKAGFNKQKVIAVTQPRRVAATTVAIRVAEEMQCEAGSLVGYCVRFEDVTSDATKIKYMTDGMLLREAILDPLLHRYSIIVLDEAHERTLHTDVLFGVVKEAQQLRRRDRSDHAQSPLKIIVMSATMDVDHFGKYFNSAGVVYLEGRTFPVQIMYSTASVSDYIHAAMITVLRLHKEQAAGEDILVFLTGQEEIELVARSLREISKSLLNAHPLLVCTLYAALPSSFQLKTFQATPKGMRKVIVSTNVAETSVTIPGIKFVVDSGFVKAKSFNPASGLDILKVDRVSKAQAWQRSGRAGRVSSGVCYRLYTEDEFEMLHAHTVPEILRSNLSGVVLQLLAMGISNVISFDFMDKPSPEAMQNAVEELRSLGALPKAEQQQQHQHQLQRASQQPLVLTELGKKMAAFPLEPRLAKVVLAACEHGCLEEVLTIVSLLSVESVFYTPHNKAEEAVEVRRKFMSSDGDHFTLLNVYRSYKGTSNSKDWCHQNFLNPRNLSMASNVRAQLKQICTHLGLSFASCGRDATPVKRSLLAGFFMNVAELRRKNEYITLLSRKPVAIHPSSCMFLNQPSYVLYNEIQLTTKCYMRDVCVVNEDILREMAPEALQRKSK